jgi:hypothetical protein
LREYELSDRVWVLKFLIAVALVIAAWAGPGWWFIVLLGYLGVLLLHYLIFLCIGWGIAARQRVQDWKRRSNLAHESRIERDAYERELVHHAQAGMHPGDIPSVGSLSWRVLAQHGRFIAGPKMQQAMAEQRQNPGMRRLVALERWRARLEGRRVRSVEEIIAHWEDGTQRSAL